MEIITYLAAAWFSIHFIECFVFKKLIAKSPDGILKAIFYTMMFGYLYLRKIKTKN